MCILDATPFHQRENRGRTHSRRSGRLLRDFFRGAPIADEQYRPHNTNEETSKLQQSPNAKTVGHKQIMEKRSSTDHNTPAKTIYTPSTPTTRQIIPPEINRTKTRS